MRTKLSCVRLFIKLKDNVLSQKANKMYQFLGKNVRKIRYKLDDKIHYLLIALLLFYYSFIRQKTYDVFVLLIGEKLTFKKMLLLILVKFVLFFLFLLF